MSSHRHQQEDSHETAYCIARGARNFFAAGGTNHHDNVDDHRCPGADNNVEHDIENHAKGRAASQTGATSSPQGPSSSSRNQGPYQSYDDHYARIIRPLGAIIEEGWLQASHPSFAFGTVADVSLFQSAMEELTEQQRTIVGMIADGHTAKLIARELRLTPRTVERHIMDCRHKLGAQNNAQLVATALRGR